MSAAMEFEDLAAAVVRWHVERFPMAEAEHVTLKACEEVGEVAKAINGWAGMNSATGGGDVGAESADVLITLMVLLGRWFPTVDLLAEVRAKYAILTDPTSGHPASIPGQESLL